MLGKSKDSFIGKADNPGEKLDSCSKEPNPLLIRGQEILKGNFKNTQVERGGYMQRNTVMSDSHLEIVHGCSDQCHLLCFKYS